MGRNEVGRQLRPCQFDIKPTSEIDIDVFMSCCKMRKYEYKVSKRK